MRTLFGEFSLKWFWRFMNVIGARISKLFCIEIWSHQTFFWMSTKMRSLVILGLPERWHARMVNRSTLKLTWARRIICHPSSAMAETTMKSRIFGLWASFCMKWPHCHHHSWQRTSYLLRWKLKREISKGSLRNIAVSWCELSIGCCRWRRLSDQTSKIFWICRTLACD